MNVTLKKNNLEAWLELGKQSSYDVSKLQSSTISSMLSHINLLHHNGYTLDSPDFLKDADKVIESLKTMKNEKLKPGYKIQIAATIHRLFPNAKINKKKYKIQAVRKARAQSVNFMEKISQLINEASQYINNKYTTTITDLGEYECCLVILLTTCTSLRIHELLQLKMSDIALIEQQEAVNIKSKSRSNNRIIALNTPLKLVFAAIKHQRPKVLDILNTSVHGGEMKRQRQVSDYIIVSSVSEIRTKLKRFAAMHHLSIETLGFNSFRSYISTVLIQNGGHQIAQSLNNHTSVDTTVSYYNIPMPTELNKTYERINNQIKNTKTHIMTESTLDDETMKMAIKYRNLDDIPKQIRIVDDSQFESDDMDLDDINILTPPPSVSQI